MPLLPVDHAVSEARSVVRLQWKGNRSNPRGRPAFSAFMRMPASSTPCFRIETIACVNANAQAGKSEIKPLVAAV
nr:hypothetical protein [Paenibacillus sp. Soil766]